MKTETEVGLMQLQTKEHLGVLGATKSWKRQEGILPYSF